MSAAATPATRFSPPRGSAAAEPPERRGTPRDGVRLLVARPGAVAHRHFRDLPELLEPGDVVVVNTSATLPAALAGRRADGAVPVHVATHLDDGRWVVELRRPDGRGPLLDGRPGERVALPAGRVLTLEAQYPEGGAGPGRLWAARVEPPTAPVAFLARHGRPIGYGHLARGLPLSDHQTVYATEPGSAEMPSAGRPFTAPLLVRLMARGVTVAPVVLHAGVSSPELHEPPMPERFRVTAGTARVVEEARGAGRRVVAVGTTVVRALESAAPEGTVREAGGWTDLVLGPGRPARVVGGLVTGLHEPEASHLLLLEAVAGPDLVGAAYAAAVEGRYLWHEFGDSMLFLP